MLSSEDFQDYDEHWRPLRQHGEALLMTRHMLFVGYSLTDENFVRLAAMLAAVREANRATPDASNDGLVGTGLTLLTEPRLADEGRRT